MLSDVCSGDVCLSDAGYRLLECTLQVFIVVCNGSVMVCVAPNGF